MELGMVGLGRMGSNMVERKPPLTLRWATDFRNARSEALLAAGTSGRCRKVNGVSTLMMRQMGASI